MTIIKELKKGWAGIKKGANKAKTLFNGIIGTEISFEKEQPTTTTAQTNEDLKNNLASEKAQREAAEQARKDAETRANSAEEENKRLADEVATLKQAQQKTGEQIKEAESKDEKQDKRIGALERAHLEDVTQLQRDFETIAKTSEQDKKNFLDKLTSIERTCQTAQMQNELSKAMPSSDNQESQKTISYPKNEMSHIQNLENDANLSGTVTDDSKPSEANE